MDSGIAHPDAGRVGTHTPGIGLPGHMQWAEGWGLCWVGPCACGQPGGREFIVLPSSITSHNDGKPGSGEKG